MKEKQDLKLLIKQKEEEYEAELLKQRKKRQKKGKILSFISFNLLLLFAAVFVNILVNNHKQSVEFLDVDLERIKQLSVISKPVVPIGVGELVKLEEEEVSEKVKNKFSNVKAGVYFDNDMLVIVPKGNKKYEVLEVKSDSSEVKIFVKESETANPKKSFAVLKKEKNAPYSVYDEDGKLIKDLIN